MLAGPVLVRVTFIRVHVQHARATHTCIDKHNVRSSSQVQVYVDAIRGGEASDPHGLTRLAETWPPCGLMYVMGLRPCEEHEHDYRQAMDHCIGRPGSVVWFT